MRSTAKPARNGKARWSANVLTLTALSFGLLLVVLLLFSHREMYETYRLGQEKSRLDEENHLLAEENLKLARTIDRLANDPEMIQDLIRRELNFVKKNEIIIQFSPSEKDKPVKAAIIPDRPPSEAKGSTDKIQQRPRPRQAPSARKTTP